jgi:hypothetical protein
VQWHNQRLKLTETAVSFSPHAKAFFREMASSAARAVTIDLVARRRSLSAVRYASLAAGEACSKENE